MKEIENIALFDLDGTLCDYDKALFEELEKIRSPYEPVFNPPVRNNAPDYIKARRKLISSSVEWWANLTKLKLGFDLWDIAEELGYRRVILTQGPKRNTNSWLGKKIWIDKNLGNETDMIITRDKSLVYGKILVDDYQDYIEKWLKWRKRGLVIMPASTENENFKHPQVIRYDGNNLKEVKDAMYKAKLRNF